MSCHTLQLPSYSCLKKQKLRNSLNCPKKKTSDYSSELSPNRPGLSQLLRRSKSKTAVSKGIGGIVHFPHGRGQEERFP